MPERTGFDIPLFHTRVRIWRYWRTVRGGTRRTTVLDYYAWPELWDHNGGPGGVEHRRRPAFHYSGKRNPRENTGIHVSLPEKKTAYRSLREALPTKLTSLDDSVGQMSSTEAEVIVKGEIHSSRGDLKHERDILVEGVDHLIIEGPREDAEYGLLQTWYAFAMLITEYLFFRILQTDTSVLEDITKAQNGDVTKTRESNASVLENSHIFARIGAAILFLVLISIAAIFGIDGSHLYGASFLIGSALLPVLLLRIHESNRMTESRDEQMANLIAEAAEDGGRVVAVVGDVHADSVIDHLPDWIDPVRERPIYPWYTWQHLKDVAYPSFVFISVLWVFYTLFVAYAKFALTIN